MSISLLSYREEVIRGVNGIIEEKNEQNATFQKYAKFFFVSGVISYLVVEYFNLGERAFAISGLLIFLGFITASAIESNEKEKEEWKKFRDKQILDDYLEKY